MKIAKWGNSLAVRIPRNMAKDMGVAEGDDVAMEVRPDGSLVLTDPKDRAKVIARITKLAKPLPPDWKFDRDEIHRW